MQETKICEYCQKEFKRTVAYSRWENRRFCSRKCNDSGRRGVPKMSTTKKCQQCSKDFEKPYTLSWRKWAVRKFCSKECADIGKIRKAPSTAFKKGNKPHNFKKTGYGYQAVHRWLNYHHTKAGKCEKCGKVSKTQWANISGKYLRNRNDYKELCYSCHTKMDKKNPKRPKYHQG